MNGTSKGSAPQADKIIAPPYMLKGLHYMIN